MTNYNRKAGSSNWFETYVNIENLKSGKHLLTISGPQKISQKKDSIDFNKKLVSIPFWYFPDNNASIQTTASESSVTPSEN